MQQTIGSRPNILTRDDTLFGVCEALGEDFGFNPLYLRVTLAVGLLWNPVAVIAFYAAAGALVALSRWLIRVPRPAAASAGARDGPEAGNDAERDIALAA